jgi:ATP-dependent 26S proteasome regulatory subunit
MLLELDSFQGVTLFATNFMSNYDSAFVRRIIGHIEMPLPTKEGRIDIYHKLIPEEYPIAFTEKDYREVSDRSDGLSGAEILNVIINAATYALDREGITCKVTLTDFTHAIRAVKKAKDANRKSSDDCIMK